MMAALKWGFAALVAAAVITTPFVEEPGPVAEAGFFVTLLIYAGLFVLQELLRPKPDIEDARPAGLGDFRFPTATQDRVVPLVWGTNLLEGPNIVWYGDLRQDAIIDDVKTGLWSSEKVIAGYKYRIGFQAALCRGPIDAVTKLYVGETLAFDGSTTSSIDVEIAEDQELRQQGFEATVDVFTGTTSQSPSDYLAGFQDAGAGTDRTPRYTGTCYLVFRELDVTAANAAGAYVGNTTSIEPISAEVQRFPGIFTGQSAGEHIINSLDCNPVNVIYEILTNEEWGFGFPEADVDVGFGSSFVSAADTMRTEENGFSMVLDKEMTAVDLLNELQRQIDGVVFLDHRTGTWKVKLARADYSIGSVPLLDDDNIKKVDDFTRGSWQDTSNQVDVQFQNRSNKYVGDFARAQDMGNALIQGGGTVTTTRPVSAKSVYPGVKTAALANNIAWRDLRVSSYPLARATITVTRELWDLTVGDPVAWTSAEYGFTQLPMRIVSIDHGRLQSNEIKLELVQDVFYFAAASYGDPPDTGWTVPAAAVVDYPADEYLVIEAPRALLSRDPNLTGALGSKVFMSARRQGAESLYEVRQRNDSGAPGGTYAKAATVPTFMRIGKLKSALGNGTAIPTTAITIEADPDTQTRILATFDADATSVDIGADLQHLIYVDGEFMLAEGASVSAADVDLDTVYRGVLDTAQKEHAAATPVFLVFFGAGLTDTTFPSTNNVDIKLIPRSITSELAEGSATTTSLTLNKRYLRPYPAAVLRYNGTSTDWGTPDLEGDGSGLNGFGFDVDWDRRGYEPPNELAAVQADDSTVDGSTEYQVKVYVDPAGSNTLVQTSSWTTGSGPIQVDRLTIIEAAAAGTEIRLELTTRHDIESETNLESLVPCEHNVTPTSTLTGQFYLGSSSAGSPGNSYTALASGTYVANIGAAFAAGNVEYRLNGGAWNVCITTGNTTGNIPGVTATDTIELRHTTLTTPDPNFVELQNPSATSVAYGTFT
jgi:hypothetical protein